MTLHLWNPPVSGGADFTVRRSSCRLPQSAPNTVTGLDPRPTEASVTVALRCRASMRGFTMRSPSSTGSALLTGRYRRHAPLGGHAPIGARSCLSPLLTSGLPVRLRLGDPGLTSPNDQSTSKRRLGVPLRAGEHHQGLYLLYARTRGIEPAKPTGRRWFGLDLRMSRTGSGPPASG